VLLSLCPRAADAPWVVVGAGGGGASSFRRLLSMRANRRWRWCDGIGLLIVAWE
jgi:hypothetical protein